MPIKLVSVIYAGKRSMGNIWINLTGPKKIKQTEGEPKVVSSVQKKTKLQLGPAIAANFEIKSINTTHARRKNNT